MIVEQDTPEQMMNPSLTVKVDQDKFRKIRQVTRFAEVVGNVYVLFWKRLDGVLTANQTGNVHGVLGCGGHR